MNDANPETGGATQPPVEQSQGGNPVPQPQTGNPRPFHHSDPAVEQQVNAYMANQMAKLQEQYNLNNNGNQGISSAEQEELKAFRDAKKKSELDKAARTGNYEPIVNDLTTRNQKLESQLLEAQVGGAVVTALQANDTVDAVKARHLMDYEVDFRPDEVGTIRVYDKGSNTPKQDPTTKAIMSLDDYTKDFLNRNEYMKKPAVTGGAPVQTNVGNNPTPTSDEHIDFNKYSPEAMENDPALRAEYNTTMQTKWLKSEGQ